MPSAAVVFRTLRLKRIYYQMTSIIDSFNDVLKKIKVKGYTFKGDNSVKMILSPN